MLYIVMEFVPGKSIYPLGRRHRHRSRRGDPPRDRHLPRPRPRPRTRHHPPGHQTVEHPSRSQRPAENRRLRTGPPVRSENRRGRGNFRNTALHRTRSRQCPPLGGLPRRYFFGRSASSRASDRETPRQRSPPRLGHFPLRHPLRRDHPPCHPAGPGRPILQCQRRSRVTCRRSPNRLRRKVPVRLPSRAPPPHGGTMPRKKKQSSGMSSVFLLATGRRGRCRRLLAFFEKTSSHSDSPTAGGGRSSRQGSGAR